MQPDDFLTTEDKTVEVATYSTTFFFGKELFKLRPSSDL